MLEELWSLSDGNKKRLLAVATIIIMVIIIGVWVTYFNSVIMGTAQQATPAVTSTSPVAAPTVATAASVPAPAQANDPSLWQNIENGFGSMVNVFKKPSQYTIQPQ